MDPRVFWEWLEVDERLRRVILERDAIRRAAQQFFIVSREEPGRYGYLKHVFAGENGDVILDRREGERRRRKRPGAAAAERRRGDRRYRDITKDLQTSGWARVMC